MTHLFLALCLGLVKVQTWLEKIQCLLERLNSISAGVIEMNSYHLERDSGQNELDISVRLAGLLL